MPVTAQAREAEGPAVPAPPLLPQGAAGKVPADRWTWRTPAGRAVSGAVGAAALGGAFALGGALEPAFWAALVAPDSVFFFGAKEPAPFARRYNTLHDPRIAAGLLAAGTALRSRRLLVAGLGWTAHIAIDRAFGFGRRRPDGAVH
ncbi:DUF4260 family protein [Streptomyces sp. NPDC050560]|uniref:DUF4260 family protein n=1 Tax=Streptomyces sp. NPDC050560 TaxID=3365630 RepID=UPI0037B421C0